MIADYITEQHQIDRVKSWIRRYGIVLMSGIVVVASCIGIWRYMVSVQHRQVMQASTLYDVMLTKRAQRRYGEVENYAKVLVHHYTETPYAQMAAFMLARNAVQKRAYPIAEHHLYWVMRHSQTAAVRQIARLRLARVLIAEHKSEEALRVLERIEDKDFYGLVYEIRGDAYVSQKNYALARQAYHHALTMLPNAESARPLLQMKYDDLA